MIILAVFHPEKEGIMSEPMRDRRREMYGEWVQESEEERALRELARSYHARCEAYDRGVCSGRLPETGEAMPVDGFELGLVNKHARERRAEVVRSGWLRYQFSEAQIAEAIKKYAKER